jgi:hypothetical protein
MPSILVGRHIQINYITLLKRSGVRNTMADHFIDGGAATTGEIVVIERGRICFIVY